jgi:hypothetical protein
MGLRHSCATSLGGKAALRVPPETRITAAEILPEAHPPNAHCIIANKWEKSAARERRKIGTFSEMFANKYIRMNKGVNREGKKSLRIAWARRKGAGRRA